MGIADEPGAGRRAYDETVVPVTKYLEEKLTRVLEERLRETRHELRQDIGDLRLTVTNGQVESAKAHAELHSTMADFGRRLDELVPLAERVDTLERHDEVDLARESTRDAVLARLDSNRRWLVGTALALAALIITAAGLLLNHS